jgi:hypothetical protein
VSIDLPKELGLYTIPDDDFTLKAPGGKEFAIR